MNGLMLMELALPVANPVVKFLILLIIILFAPLVLSKLRIPSLLGLILAGAVVGPHGFHIMERDSGIILSGTAGLLYIMFLAGLEIDLNDFKNHSRKSIVFGIYTFTIPMLLGIFVGIYVLNYTWITSVLLASMFASHTLITYPIISKMGISKNRAVSLTIGGTLITDTLALLILAVIVGITKGEVSVNFWLSLLFAVMLFGVVVTFLFPIIARWFFKHYEDNSSQYVFVLVMVFGAAAMAQWSGIEAIIGAFLSGLALNRLISKTSPLMNRIDFVGNTIFIPIFLIGVGMLIDYRSFIGGWDTLTVALVMTVIATLAKYLASWITQKTFRLTRDERRLIFGLSNSQAAATLAAVMIGFNIIVGTTDNGEPIRLLNENVLNGTIVMILVTCTIASFVTQRGARNIAIADEVTSEEENRNEKILISVRNIDTVEELIQLGVLVKTKGNLETLNALTIVDHSADKKMDLQARKVLNMATKVAASTDNLLSELLRYDTDIVNGIVGAVKENNITDLILGLHHKGDVSDSLLGQLTEGILSRCSVTTLICKFVQPLSTVKRHIVVVYEHAEKDIGFPFWLIKLWNLARNSGASLRFFAFENTVKYLNEIMTNHPVDCDFVTLTEWNMNVLPAAFKTDDSLILISNKKDRMGRGYDQDDLGGYLNQYFRRHNFILVYPMQLHPDKHTPFDFKNPSLMEPALIADAVARLFKKK